MSDPRGAKRARAEERAVDEALMAKLRKAEEQYQTMLAAAEEQGQKVTDEFDQKIAAVQEAFVQKVAKKIPTFWADTFTTSETLQRVISDEDKKVLATLKSARCEPLLDGLAMQVRLEFDGPNDLFEDKVLWRRHGHSSLAKRGGDHAASGVTWKTGKEPEKLRVAGDEEAYSFFELFEEGNLSEEEIPVLMAVFEICAEPYQAYLGESDLMEDMEMDEETEDDDADADEDL